MPPARRPQQTPQQPAHAAAPAPAAEVLACSDLVKAILGRLGVHGICACAAVCRLWRQVADSDSFWEEVTFDSTRHVTREQLLAVLTRHTGIRRLSLLGLLRHETTADTRQLGRALCRMTRLSSLTVSGACMPAESAAHLLAAPKLGELRLEGVKLMLSAAQLPETVFHHSALRRLELDGCDVSRLSLRCPRLVALSVRGGSVHGIAAVALPALEDLDLTGCAALSDASLRGALMGLTSLRRAALPGGAGLSDETLRAAAGALPALEALALQGCGAAVAFNGLQARAGGFPALTRLELRSCDSVDGPRLAAVLEGSPLLAELLLEGCLQLHALTLQHPRLASVRLAGCRHLRSAALRCRQLTSLSFEPPSPGLPGCTALTSLSLLSDSARRLELRGLPALSTVRLEAPALRELAVAECDALAAPALAAAVGGRRDGPGGAAPPGDAGAHLLECLRIDGCGGMRELELRHRNLRRLSVSGCARLSGLAAALPSLAELSLEDCPELSRLALRDGALTGLALGSCSGLVALALEAPRLASLDLRGCGRLERLFLGCPRLEALDATFCAALSDQTLQDLAAGGGFGRAGFQAAFQGLGAGLDFGGGGGGGGGGAAALLAAAASARPGAGAPPPLQRLVLSVCTQVTSSGLAALSALTGLLDLDLSYSEVSDVSPVFGACGRLASLTLASCKQLDAACLLRLAGGGEGEGGGPQAAALPCLRELDLSYCAVPGPLAEALALCCTQLSALHLNGVDGVGCGLWRALARGADAPAGPEPAAAAAAAAAAAEAGAMDVDGGGPADGGAAGAAGGSMLEVLSLVRCPGLRSMCLGLAPADGALPTGPAAPRGAAPPPPDAPAWRPPLWPAAWAAAPAPLGRLRALRLGLSAVEAVALDLPLLEHLELSGCTQLRCLWLRCPRLGALLLQSCGALGRPQLDAALSGCPALAVLDLQHTGWGSLGALQAAADEARRGEGAVDECRRGAALAALGARHMREQDQPALNRRPRRPGQWAWGRPGGPQDAAGKWTGRRGPGGGAQWGGDDAGGGAPDAVAPAAAGGPGHPRGLQSVLVCGSNCPVCSRRSVTCFA
ncbi:MAG: hypothetical protein J3K34DRAFT_526127 [Monoraphidium minutum]|nr:MAG: hypothetical protein J3K34DRAFT_526127 [Monoraphidium minutum]